MAKKFNPYNKPLPPYKPTEPSKTILKEEVIKEIPYDESQKIELDSIKDIPAKYITIDVHYDSEYVNDIIIVFYNEVEVDNPNYNTLMKDYNKQYKIYEANLKDYEDELKVYNEKLEIYNKEQEEREKKARLEQYKKLKKEFE